MTFDASTSLLAGRSQQQLQADLSAAQQAFLDISMGNKGVQFSYSQGDGSKSVTYSQTNLQDLASLIRLLQAQLGIICKPRRPVRFNFR